MYTWSLDKLYPDFNEAYAADLKVFDSKLDELTSLAETLNGKEDLENWIRFRQELQALSRNLGSFTSLRMATNVNDSQAKKYFGQLMNISSKSARPAALFSKWIYAVRAEFESWLNESELIKEHEFILREEISSAKHTLNEDVEVAISRMRINASSNWSQLQSHLTSNTTIEFRGEKHTMTSLRNLAYDSDPLVRQEAYETELALYKKIEDSIAYSLNSIKGEVIHTNQMRGYASPLSETLEQSRLSKETLDALVYAIENNLPNFRRYLKHKAKVFGHEGGLPWYDLFATHEVKDEKTYTVEDAQDMILDNFRSFSDDLADMAQQAFDENWIDYLPKEGKRGGAFCSNLPQIKESRVMLNFGGSISDVVTMAHELGHAYHGLMIQNNSLLNTGYSMPVAETASTFCENILFNASLSDASDDEKIMLIENSLQDVTQITVDILSRYKFESNVLALRENEFLDSAKLQEIMVQAQKDTYGDGLASYHPYMWACKGHYYSAGRNFYNFPYAFGGLFALGLYAQYQQEGKSFVDKYRTLLKQTTVASCEDVAKVADVDITDVAFWASSIGLVNNLIDQYIELTS